jgi:uncharacterized protein (UPF0335 family)
MSDAGAVARDQLACLHRAYRASRRREETIADDIKDVYAEAKGMGFDTKVLRKVVPIRKQDQNERMEQEAVLDLYLHALGMAPEPEGAS